MPGLGIWLILNHKVQFLTFQIAQILHCIAAATDITKLSYIYIRWFFLTTCLLLCWPCMCVAQFSADCLSLALVTCGLFACLCALSCSWYCLPRRMWTLTDKCQQSSTSWQHSLISFSFCFQIRVVNAFQEPAATPAQMPFRGRTSLASLASVAAKLESSKSEPKMGDVKGDTKGAETKTAPPIDEAPSVEAQADNAENEEKPAKGEKGETCV